MSTHGPEQTIQAGEGRVQATQPLVFSADETTSPGYGGPSPAMAGFGRGGVIGAEVIRAG